MAGKPRLMRMDMWFQMMQYQYLWMIFRLNTESQETVDFTPKQEPVQQVESLENEKNVAGQTKHNFHYNLWEMEKGGPKTRYQWNMDAIRTLKQIESVCRSLSDGADCHRHLMRITQAGAKNMQS